MEVKRVCARCKMTGDDIIIGHMVRNSLQNNLKMAKRNVPET